MVTFFSLSYSLRDQKKTKLFQKQICWIISFWNFHLEETPKSANRVEIPRNCNSLSSKYTQLHCFFRVFIEILTLVQGYCMEKSWSSPLCQNANKPVMRKNCFTFRKARLSITSFPQKNSLNFFGQPLNLKVQFAAIPFHEKCWFGSLLQKPAQPKNPKKSYELCSMSMFKPIFLGKCRLDFIHCDLNRKANTFKGGKD